TDCGFHLFERRGRTAGTGGAPPTLEEMEAAVCAKEPGAPGPVPCEDPVDSCEAELDYMKSSAAANCMPAYTAMVTCYYGAPDEEFTCNPENDDYPGITPWYAPDSCTAEYSAMLNACPWD
ncbi:MAG TPA: hypothetical protein VGK73_39825, partial [Polyangiaceae bacterium]